MQMLRQKVIRKKTLKKLYLVAVFKVTEENSRIRIQSRVQIRIRILT